MACRGDGVLIDATGATMASGVRHRRGIAAMA
jgi:hypothetical protein